MTTKLLMVGRNMLKIRGWPVFRAVLLTALLLYLSGLLGRTISPAKTIVTITFDDGYSDQYEAAAILRVHGMRATYYIINKKIGQAGYLSWDELKRMQTEGNEIGGHTLTHPFLTDLQGYPLQHEICDSRVDFINRGFKTTSFAYSYGVHNDETDEVVAKCGFNSGRSVGGRQDTNPPELAYSIRTMDPVQADTTQVMLRGYIKQTERAGGGWVLLLFHHVCENCDKYSITPDAFSKFLDWLRVREPDGTVVRTVDEVIGGTPKPAVEAGW